METGTGTQTDPTTSKGVVVINKIPSKKATKSIKKKIVKPVKNAKPDIKQRWRMYKTVEEPYMLRNVQAKDDLISDIEKAFGEQQSDDEKVSKSFRDGTVKGSAYISGQLSDEQFLNRTFTMEALEELFGSPAARSVFGSNGGRSSLSSGNGGRSSLPSGSTSSSLNPFPLYRNLGSDASNTSSSGGNRSPGSDNVAMARVGPGLSREMRGLDAANILSSAAVSTRGTSEVGLRRTPRRMVGDLFSSVVDSARQDASALRDIFGGTEVVGSSAASGAATRSQRSRSAGPQTPSMSGLRTGDRLNVGKRQPRT